MHGGENGFHLRQVRLDCLAQREAICRLDEDFRDQNIAAAVAVDPFNGIVRIRSGSRFRPTKFFQFPCKVFRGTIRAVNNQYFHWASCLR